MGIPRQAAAGHDGRGGLLFGPGRRSLWSFALERPAFLPDATGWPPAAPFRVAAADRWGVEWRLLFEDGHASAPARWNVVGARAAPAEPLAGELAAGIS